jgi:peroxiredoxin
VLGVGLGISAAVAQTESVNPIGRREPGAVKAAEPTPPPAPPITPVAPTPAGQGSGKIAFAETTHDFGDIWLGDPLEFYFTVRNEGTTPLQITDVKASCGCTAIPDYTKVIAPGETGRVGARLDSTKIGTDVPVAKTITVSSSDAAQPSTILTIKALVKAFVKIEPKMVNLGNLTSPDQEVSQVVTITNNTEQPLTLEADPVTGSDRFAATLDEIEKGKVFKATVKGVPPFAEGQMRSIFRYRTNIEKQPSVDFTAFAMLPPRLQLNQQQIVLTAPQPTAQPRAVQLFNNGKEPIKVTSAEVDDPDVKVTFSEQQTQQPPTAPGQPSATRQTWLINLEFPPNYMPPETGRTLTIKTDDTQLPVMNVAIRAPAKPAPPKPNPVLEMVGKPAPPTEIRTLTGDSLVVGTGENPPTVLVFYTTWCPHCRNELPTIQKIHDAYKEKGVRVVGVSLDDYKDRKNRQQPFTAEMLGEHAKQNNLTFTMAHDPSQKVAMPFKVTGYPCTFVINKAGLIESVYPGEVAEGALRTELDRVLAGKPKEVLPTPPLAPIDATQKTVPSVAPTQAPGH